MYLLQALIKKGLLKKGGSKYITDEMESTGKSMEEVLIRQGISPTDILAAKGEYFGIPTKMLDSVSISDKILSYIPEESATHYHAVPLGVTDGVLEIGMLNPDDIEARDALNFISAKIGMPIKIFVMVENDFAKVFSLYKGLTGEVSKSLSEFGINPDTVSLDVDKTKQEQVDESNVTEDAPVTKMVSTILSHAAEGNASDIHIEPWRDSIKVRFRVDGIMNTSLVLPSTVHTAVVARIKIMCNMRLDEQRKPQDGRFTTRIASRRIDFRVSTFPTYFGEKVVMRLLDQEKGVKKLDALGMSKRNLALVQEAITKPYGLILISGPTGSGKTTTLYSMLNELDREHRNVLSLEDPIEYNIEGISQSQVRAEIGYTFAAGLRTTLRQDPDIIMVGEIRDKETAELAIQAALTGHLVLSTIHTNSAIGVIPRLIDMGVDPYLIAPTLILSIAQRLTLGLAPGAGKPMPVEGGLKNMVDKQFKDLPEEFKKELEFTDNVYQVSPTPDCPSGTRGRVAVMEVLKVDSEIQSVILKNVNEQEIAKLARLKGMLSMKEDALIKAMHQLIPFEEVNTV